jgi:hypothetical protein
MGKYNQLNSLRLVHMLLGLMLLCGAGNASAFTPESGWWWNPDESGRGVNLDIQNGTIFLATFIYDDNGAPIWFSGSGVLDSNNVASFDLIELANGQCIRCEYQAPDVVDTIERIAIRFNSPGTAEIDWSNGTLSIQRFNFALGENWQNQLLGEWALVSGGSVFPAYDGDRITFDAVQQSDTLDVIGHRTGNTNAKITIFDASGDPIRDFTRFGFMSTNLDTLRAFAFNLSGLNRLEGVTVDMPSSSSASEITQALRDRGVQFIGFRVK